MDFTEERPDVQTTPGAPVVHLLFPGDPHSVRRALGTALEILREIPRVGPLAGVIEIVLAEVLNNVAEHAYAGQGRGLVELKIVQTGAALWFHIRDEGEQMPGCALPPGRVQDLDVETEDLPEGGFGWFLIRELTRDLRYRRVGNRNELTFQMPVDARTHGA